MCVCVFVRAKLYPVLFVYCWLLAAPLVLSSICSGVQYEFFSLKFFLGRHKSVCVCVCVCVCVRVCPSGNRGKLASADTTVLNNKNLDRGSRGTSDCLFYMAHSYLQNFIYLCSMTDTFTQASGRVWNRVGAIPMGSPFSGQSADLQSVWRVKRRVDLMCKLGTLWISPQGHPIWTTPQGNDVSLAQFRDNVLVGVCSAFPKTEILHVTHILPAV